MKKCILWLLAIVLLLNMSGLAQAEGLEGGSSDKPVQITEDMYGVVYDAWQSIYGYHGWYSLSAPADGVYHISFAPVPNTDIHIVQIVRMNGDKIERYYLKEKETFTLEVTAKEKVLFEVGAWTTYSSYTFCVCFNDTHPYTDYSEIYKTTAAQATCTAAGRVEYPCEYCGEAVKIEEIPALGHTPGEPKISKAATCTETGLMETRCVTCGEVLSSSEIPATGHQPGAQAVIQPATCMQEGVEGVNCTTCGALLSSQPIPMTAHTLGQWTTVKNATCTAEGQRSQSCAVCGATVAT